MAIDTRSKRASVLGIGLTAALTLPLSDGTVGQPDRQHVTFCYAGITAQAASRFAAANRTSIDHCTGVRAISTCTGVRDIGEAS